MKKFFLILIAGMLVASFSFRTNQPCGTAPELNKKIIEIVKASIGKKIGQGECWDVAAEALNKTGAKWDGNYKFGKEIDYKKACVYPGDIVQFEGVELKYNIEDAFYIEKLTHHTAIIYSVKSKGDFIIADQNTKHSGKKVATHAFDVKTVTKGKYTIYRPQN
jgi:hypothetical protein